MKSREEEEEENGKNFFTFSCMHRTTVMLARTTDSDYFHYFSINI
jgi:hypothetical protein